VRDTSFASQTTRACGGQRQQQRQKQPQVQLQQQEQRQGL